MSLRSMFGIGMKSVLSEGEAVSGTVTAVHRCWWLKVNTKSVRWGPMDGAYFPHIITFRYTVDGTEYTARRWLSYSTVPPAVGKSVVLRCDPTRPNHPALDTAQFGVRL